MNSSIKTNNSSKKRLFPYLLKLIGILFFSISAVMAQDKMKDKELDFFVRIDNEYIANTSFGLELDVNGNSAQGLLQNAGLDEYNFRLSAGVKGKQKFSYSIGAVVNNGYLSPTLTSFAEVLYDIGVVPDTYFIGTSFGKIFPLYTDNRIWVADARRPNFYYPSNGISRGFNLQICIGRRIKFFRKLAAIGQIGYDFKAYSLDADRGYFRSKESLSSSGIIVRLGIMIN